jgi:choline dehydrogenase
LIEAAGDHGENPLQMAPLLGAAAAENETMSWEFFVNHYRDFEQGRRDSKYTYRLPNGELYIGLDPPEGATPYVTLIQYISASGHREESLI